MKGSTLRLTRSVAPLFLLSGLLACMATTAGGREIVDLQQTVGGSWLAVNRAPTLIKQNGMPVVRLDTGSDFGMVWSPAIEFRNGDIEFDVRGRNEAQKSFVGLAFHIADDSTLDVVWLRPFNFRAADSVARSHAVQFASYPAFSWQRLRQERPGVFEASVPGGADPNGWNHVRVNVNGPQVQVYMNGDSHPILSVRSPSTRDNRGGIGLWVGSNSNGDFSNLRIHSVAPAI